MNGVPSQALDLRSAPLSAAVPETEASPLVLAEARQRTGLRLIVSGFVITVAGVILYSLACFAGGVDANVGDMLFRNSVPFVRTTLGVLGLGTLVWLVGSFVYLQGAMDADDAGEEPRF
jgi:hypothetical protein